MAQGSRSNNQIINLDDNIVGQRLSRPAKVFLLGREWTVRRDLDAVEALEFWSKVTENDPTVLAMLMGEEATDLNERLLKLPLKVYNRIVTGIFAASGLKRGDEPEDTTGEFTAS